MLTEPLVVTLLVTDALEKLEVPYFIGGSLATAMHGVVRATMGVDLVADIEMEHVEPFIQALGSAFYADAVTMREAIQRKSSFNVIHRETMFKVDIFVPAGRPFDRSQFERRVLETVAEYPKRTAYFASPEDNVLASLEWYRMGGEISDRQWQDIVYVLKVQGERLDAAGVADAVG